MRLIIITTLTFALAVLSGMVSFATAGAKQMPYAAAASQIADGPATALLAKIEYASAQARANGRPVAPSERAVALAREAYRKDPLAPDMLALMALAKPTGDPSAATILLMAHRMSRQSTIVNYALIESYARKGDEESSLRLIDETLRRETPVQGVLLQRLASVVSDRSLHSGMLSLLRDKPLWAEQFWRQLAQTPTGIPGAAALRIAYAGEGGVVSSEVDRLLVDAITQYGSINDARLVACRILRSEKLATCGRGGVTNETFSSRPRVWPFDWRLTSTGDYGATIEPERSTLYINAIQGSRGTAVEQLVRLTDQTYVLSVDMDKGAGTNGAHDHVTVRMTCAGTGALMLERPLRTLRAEFQRGHCTWAWIRFDVAMPSDEPELLAVITRVSLSPL